MNCQDFERIINDLARDPVMEATQRASALAHAEGCARCAARLADESALTVGLRSLAASMQHGEAPARVEAALVSAFRERDKAARLKPSVQPTTFAVERQRRRWAAAGIAAAVALLFITLAAFRIYQQSPQQQAVAMARDSQPLRLARWPSAQDEPAPSPAPAASAMERGPQQLAFQRVSNRTRPGMNENSRIGGSIKRPQPVNTATANSTGGDIATDFIPLTYGADLNALDSGRVVRVELPRTALARFGLPMNAERAAEPVKADVLLGEDGLAQAIRFVR